MRTLLAGLVLMVGAASSANADVPAPFDVPTRTELREAVERRPEAQPTHELVLAADVIARPGETPAEALSRALHGSSETKAPLAAR